MAGKRDWLDAGLALLAEQGAPAVTIERLADGLGLSKGSFYHHFKGMTGFRTALLEHFEAERTTRFVEQAEAAGGDRLDALLKLVLAPGRWLELEIAVRAWALQDAEARAVQERVDRTRLAYLTEISGDADLALALFLVVVGAGQVLPPPSGRQLKNALELVLGRRK
ncbi:TetR/AcrR family transcriptional regulator [Amycolatopsis sp. OK19-0408]|uniref:TetR/AcrR family transcriptional regulator n=1 Tax=Amycolatopsis iheyensis TaxID=2945988 RepID=A0A9X2SGX8_9PSEU|nr:TetR/AcrR family transcriptional regulator [Amycolatopsis iheyensis]MCR6481839.1 TetR/AcrR family transcriptional regulator [Amycolatopsis iheyensis]